MEVVRVVSRLRFAKLARVLLLVVADEVKVENVDV